MNDPGSTPFFLADPAAVAPIPRSIQQAYLWAIGGIGTVAAAAVLIVAVATQSGADSERIAGSSPDGVKGLLSAIVATHGRPGTL